MYCKVNGDVIFCVESVNKKLMFLYYLDNLFKG